MAHSGRRLVNVGNIKIAARVNGFMSLKNSLIHRNYANLDLEVERRTKKLKYELGRVKELSDAKDAFIRNAVHELKNPLSVIINSLFIFKDVAPAGKEKEWSELFDILRRNTDKLMHMVEQMLQLSRLGSIVHKSDAVDLTTLLRRVYKENLPVAKAKRIAFELNQKPAVVIGDEELMGLAINNLVARILEFTPKGKVRLSVSKSGSSILISIYSSEVMLSKSDQHKLFDPHANIPFAGIGVTLAKAIIEEHNGSIGVRNAKGSTFEIVLPMPQMGKR